MALSPEKLKSVFYLSQIAFGVLVLGWFLLRKGKSDESGFRVREWELKAGERGKKKLARGPDLLAQAKMEKAAPVAPLRLSGIRIDGAPHEVLGVRPQASADEVQKAYRDLMKRYHPDVIGPPDSREWKDAQKIAEALNRAKKAMDQKLKPGKP